MMPNNKADELRKLNEAYEDGLFRLAMNDLAAAEGKVFLEENEQLKSDPENLPSPESINRFTKLLDARLRKMKKSQRNHRTLKILSKVAVALIVIIVFLSTMIATVQAFRIQVLNFLIKIEPKYTSLQLKDNDNAHGTDKLIVNWTNTYIPTYVPDGYEVSSISYTDLIKKLVFNNPNDNTTITYTEYDSSNTIAVDTEGASFIEKVNINGHDGTLSIKDSITSIAWTIDNHLFTIQGRINTDVAAKMAEGVKFIK